MNKVRRAIARFMEWYPMDISILPNSGDMIAADRPKTMLTIPEASTFLLRVPQLYKGQGRDIDEAGGKAVEKSPSIDHVNRCRIGNNNRAASGEDDA